MPYPPDVARLSSILPHSYQVYIALDDPLLPVELAGGCVLGVDGLVGGAVGVLEALVAGHDAGVDLGHLGD